jgi:hypothetical protein
MIRESLARWLAKSEVAGRDAEHGRGPPAGEIRGVRTARPVLVRTAPGLLIRYRQTMPK